MRRSSPYGFSALEADIVLIFASHITSPVGNEPRTVVTRIVHVPLSSPLGARDSGGCRLGAVLTPFPRR